MSTEEKAVQQNSELRERMAKHLTALVFDQVDNNGEWLVHQEYTEGLVDAALVDWRREFEAVNKELLQFVEQYVASTNCICRLNDIMKKMDVHVPCTNCEAKALIAKARAI